MKQEDRELLYKALCMYLPYDVKVEQYNERRVVLEVVSRGLELESIKPLLVPLEHLNDKLKEEFERKYTYCFDFEWERYLGMDEDMREYEQEYITIDKLPFEVIEFYLRNHGDIYGLIPKGLAINKIEI